MTAYDQRGFPTVIVQAKGASKKYNDQGFLITDSPTLAGQASPTAGYSDGEIGVIAAAKVNNKASATESAAVSRQDLTQLYLVGVGALAALAATLAL